MVATLEQAQSELLKLIEVAQRGEEVLIAMQGQAVAKLTAVPRSNGLPDRQAWLARLAILRARIDTGKSGMTVEQILQEDRGD